MGRRSASAPRVAAESDVNQGPDLETAILVEIDAEGSLARPVGNDQDAAGSPTVGVRGKTSVLDAQGDGGDRDTACRLFRVRTSLRG